MSYLVTAATMRELDRTAIEEYGIPGAVLMELAGAGTAEAILKRWPKIRRVGILAGSGNNGGDGYVIARHLINAGINTTTYLLATRDQIEGDAKINLDILVKMNAPLVDVPDPQELRRLHRDLENMHVLVDAMLGTGLKSNLKGIYKEAVEELNSARVPVCAVDIPSGLSADTGRPMGDSVRAALTCTYGLKKIGQVLYPGVVYIGDLEVIDIGLPREMVERLVEKVWLIEPDWVQLLLPLRDAEAHKGDFGHLFVLAGSLGKTGAAAMTAESAVRSGAGLVTVGVPASLNSIMEIKTTEAMTLPLADNDSGFIHADSWADVEAVLERCDAIAIGPGLGIDPSTAELFFKLMEYTSLPMVIDADGLNILAEKPEILKAAQTCPVITPHPGEMGRLLNTSGRRVQEDRISAARQCAELTGAVVVLKGARTIVAEPEGRLAINPTGNPGMATGGTGDVLTGTVGAFLAQGMQPFEAACASVWIHGRAGDLAEECMGRISLKATDLMDNLPLVFRDLTGR